MMINTTDRPWTIEILPPCDTEPGEGYEIHIQAYADPDGENGASLAWVNTWKYGTEYPKPESIANAKFIVKACNNHDKLVELVKALVGMAVVQKDMLKSGEIETDISPDQVILELSDLIKTSEGVLREAKDADTN